MTDYPLESGKKLNDSALYLEPCCQIKSAAYALYVVWPAVPYVRTYIRTYVWPAGLVHMCVHAIS